MCDARRLATCLSLLVVLATAGARTLRGQDPAAYRARIERLQRTQAALAALAARQDSARRGAIPRDTIVEGAFTILVDSADRALARSAAARATRVIASRMGAAGVAAAARTIAVRRVARANKPGTPPVVEVMDVDSTGRLTGAQQQVADVDAVARDLEERSARRLMSAFGPAVQRWAGRDIPLDLPGTDAWRNAHIDLVLSQSSIARACLDGDVSACGRALGLVGRDAPLANWYDAQDRRFLVERMRGQWTPGLQRDAAGCVAARLDSACNSVLATLPTDALTPLLGGEGRDVLRLAMSIGGPGAFARMQAAADDPAAVVQAAAGISTDSVLATWHTLVIQAREQDATLRLSTAVGALFCVGVCGALSLRSSRWR
ncbi:MAG TPA: hypothetical protein VG818_03530 [Gemmatimonadaceae bacterium]|nr:hypothetical protein [Gemmatimonadaceae bacterium]